MAPMHGGGHGSGHGPGLAMFTAEGGEQVVLNDDGEWTSDDGSRRIVVRRAGPDGGPVAMEGETINIEGGEGGERRIIIRRSGPDGETVDVEDGHGAHGDHAGGERQVFVFRHEGEGGLDADGDGRWSFEEMVAPIREHFTQMDANHDGFVDGSERNH